MVSNNNNNHCSVTSPRVFLDQVTVLKLQTQFRGRRRRVFRSRFPSVVSMRGYRVFNGVCKGVGKADVTSKGQRFLPLQIDKLREGHEPSLHHATKQGT